METMLTAIAIAVAVLVGFFTIASAMLALLAIVGWKELIGKAQAAAIAAAKDEARTAREHIAKEAQEEARKWVEIYNDPAKMFKQFGYVLSSESPSPLPPTAPKTPDEASNESVGERLVEAMAAEPERPSDQPPAKDILQGKEESDAVRAEARPEANGPRPTGEPEPDPEPEQR
jgi:hypothetical protein